MPDFNMIQIGMNKIAWSNASCYYYYYLPKKISPLNVFRVVFLIVFAIVFKDMPLFVALVLPINQHIIRKKKIKSTDSCRLVRVMKPVFLWHCLQR